ncbi:MAG: T9SS type A sorting domain-containing protein [Bacteroidetes bacterium]|nr:T9SS type A sorting domain-containing protein [Bacteroidota bacterium]
MKHLYLTAFSLALLGGTANAQSLRNTQLHNLKDRSTVHQASHLRANAFSNRAVIWSDDFSVPANWTIGNINDAHNDNWVIGTTPPGGSFAIPPIASTTAANGFALFDSDLLCGNTQNAWIATANPIDLSTEPGVVLQFQQYYRKFQGQCFVETSTNGTTWNTIEVNAGLAVNSSTANPQLLSLDLTNQIGGAPTAWVRFRYQGGCDYAWMIDDVKLITLPPYELITENGFVVPFGDGYEYGRIPQSQLPPSLSVGAQVVNFGGQQQTNVTLTTTITGPGGATVGTVTHTVGTMNHNDTTNAAESFSLPTPTPLGLYTFKFEVSSDQIGQDENANNNVSYRYLQVTQDLYSLDGIGVYPDSIVTLTTLGTGSFTNNNQDVRFLNYYKVQAQQTFTGVEVALNINSSYTQPGSYFIAAVYDTADVYIGTPLSSPLVESDIRVITQADLDNGTAQVAFLNTLTLPVGAYYVAIRAYNESGNDLYILDDLTVPQPFDATMLWLPNDDQSQNIYSNGNAMAIRLSSSPNVAVQETSNLAGVTMYPSPTNGPVEVHVATAGKMTVEVFNALGKLVSTSSFNGTTTKVDLTGNSAGIYTVRVSDGARYNVQRITLK